MIPRRAATLQSPESESSRMSIVWSSFQRVGKRFSFLWGAKTRFACKSDVSGAPANVVVPALTPSRAQRLP
jgi:hypothetical protein